MNGALLFSATAVLSGLGFALLALSQKAHRGALPRRLQSARPLVLRLTASALLAASLAPAVLRDGWMFGVIVWITVLTVSAGVVAVLLAKRHER